MSQNASFKKDSPEVANFLADQKANTLDRMLTFKEALEKPDGPIGVHAPVPLHPQRSESRLPEDKPPISTGMAMEVAQPEPNRGGRPLHGKKPKVEKTFAIDDEIHAHLIAISNWEGIRHGKKFSVSHIMNHCLAYALSHAEGTHVIPINGAEGLVIASKGDNK